MNFFIFNIDHDFFKLQSSGQTLWLQITNFRIGTLLIFVYILAGNRENASIYPS